jgi:hypothetical protein
VFGSQTSTVRVRGPSYPTAEPVDEILEMCVLCL